MIMQDNRRPRLRAAVIGVGYLGRFHAQKYIALSKELPVDLVGVCDINFDQSQRVAAELGVTAFQNPADLIGKVDLVSIATVTSSHFEVADLFLSRGIHCNVEKPLSVTVAESEALLNLSKKQNLILCVGHSERFNPAYIKAKQLIPHPYVVELSRHAPYKSRGADVSVIHDLMIHDFDLLESLVNSDISIVAAEGASLISSTLDWAQAVFKWGNRNQAIVSSSRMASQMTRSLRLIGHQESVFCDLQTGEVSWVKYLNKDQPTIENFSCGKGDNLLSENREFVKAVLGEKNVAVSGADGVKAMRRVHEVVDMIEANH